MSMKKTIEIEAIAKDAVEQIQALTAKVEGLEKSLSDAGKETKKTNKILGGLSTLLKTGLGIGIVKTAFDLLKTTFQSNQKVVDVFRSSTEALSLAFNDLFNYLDRNVGTVIDYFKGIFNDPVQAIKDFGVAIYENIVERFNSLLDTLGYLASAVKKVFSRDFAGALEDVKSAGKESLDVLTGVDNSFEKTVETVTKATKSIVAYAKSTYAAAESNVELQKSAELGIAQNRIILEQYDRQAERLRQIRDDEQKTIAERIAANEKLGEVLDEQERLMIANADAVILAAQAQYNKNANDENQIALLEARAEKEGILAQIEGFRSEQLMNLNSLERESLDIQKEVTEAKIALQMQELDNAQAAFGILADMAGKSRALQAVAIIGENAVSAAKQIISTKAANAAVTAKYALLPGGAILAAAEKKLNNISLGIGLAASAVATGKALSALKTGGGGGQASSFRGAAGGDGSGTSAPQVPDFNIVGASSTSQLAETIAGQEKQPVKAYVVSDDVSTQQALDRKIVKGASIG